MTLHLTVIETKRGDKLQYVGTYVRGQRVHLVDDIMAAGNFTDKEDLITIAASGLRLPTDKIYAFSAAPVDSIEVVEVELVKTEISRKQVVR